MSLFAVVVSFRGKIIYSKSAVHGFINDIAIALDGAKR